MKEFFVYQHINKQNGKRYIGITSQKTPQKRWKNGLGYMGQPLFYNAIVKYGWDGFTHEVKVYMDSAEPRSIEYMKSQRFNALPCIKGKDSVKARISFLQNNEIIVHPKCKNLINELENFSYKKDKVTGEYTEDMTHEFSHAIDGLCYMMQLITLGKT